MVDVVPDDRVILASGHRPPDGEDQLGVERALQQLADLATLVAVGQVSLSTTAGVRHTWIGMSLLYQSQQHRCDPVQNSTTVKTLYDPALYTVGDIKQCCDLTVCLSVRLSHALCSTTVHFMAMVTTDANA